MIASVTNGYADIYTWENLYSAWRKAGRGKRNGRAAAGHRRLLSRKGYHFQRQLMSLMDAYKAHQVGRAEIDRSVRGWINHVGHADTWGLRRSLLKGVRL